LVNDLIQSCEDGIIIDLNELLEASYSAINGYKIFLGKNPACKMSRKTLLLNL